jgi:hypothetical protein
VQCTDPAASALAAITLHRLYVTEQLTMVEISRRLACSASTVRRRLQAGAIPIRPRGPNVAHRRIGRDGTSGWSAEIAWVVGLMASDGNLASTGHTLSLTSNDVDLLASVRAILGLDNTLGRVRGGWGTACHRLQWRDRVFHGWLVAIGLMPRKSLTLGPLAIPDHYFADFLRGCIDGDGTILVYTDRHHAARRSTYVYQRLYVSLVSASRPFLGWVQDTVARLQGLRGTIYDKSGRRQRPLWALRYAKRESLRLLPWLYAGSERACLARKRARAEPFMPGPK